MSGEKDLEQLKKEAAAKAKASFQAREKAEGQVVSEESEEDLDLAKEKGSCRR